MEIEIKIGDDGTGWETDDRGPPSPPGRSGNIIVDAFPLYALIVTPPTPLHPTFPPTAAAFVSGAGTGAGWQISC